MSSIVNPMPAEGDVWSREEKGRRRVHYFISGIHPEAGTLSAQSSPSRHIQVYVSSLRRGCSGWRREASVDELVAAASKRRRAG